MKIGTVIGIVARWRWLILSLTIISTLTLLASILLVKSDPQLIRTIKTSSGISAIVFSPTEHVLATGDLKGQIQIWNVADGSLVHTWAGHHAKVLSLAFSSDGQWLVSAGYDGTVRLWQVTTGVMIRVLMERHPDPGHALYEIDPEIGEHMVDVPFYSVIFSPDDRTVAIGSNEGHLAIVQRDTGQVVRYFQNPPMWQIRRVSFSPDGHDLAAAGDDGGVCLWRVQDGRLLMQFAASPTTGTIHGMAFRPDGTVLAVGGATSVVNLWSLNNERVLLNAELHPGFVQSVAFSADLQLVALGGGVTGDDFGQLPFLGKKNDTRIFIWRIGGLEPMLILRGHTSNVTSLAFSSDGNLLASGGYDRTIRFWRVQ